MILHKIQNIACLSAKSKAVSLKIHCQPVLSYTAPAKTHTENELWVTDFKQPKPYPKSSFYYIPVKETTMPMNSASKGLSSLVLVGVLFIVLLISIWHKWKNWDNL